MAFVRVLHHRHPSIPFNTNGKLWIQTSLRTELVGEKLKRIDREEEFKALLKKSPHVLRLIPHKYLALYLGIDATTFSKLLGSVRIE